MNKIVFFKLFIFFLLNIDEMGGSGKCCGAA